jgi:hypothetical protein
MAETIRDSQARQEGQPPAGGRQDHNAMRAASMRTLEVDDAATDVLAASGGLDVPGRNPRGAAGIEVPTESLVPEQIPGARDPSNLTHSQPGAMGSLFNVDLPANEPSTLTDVMRHERAMEGGEDKG